MKSGFISIVGRPNTGKSTLINTIINKKIAIVSNVAGTTRNTIQGVYHDEDTQIVFVDTPGIHKASDKLGKHLNKQSYESLEDIDAILFVVDASTGLGKGDKFIIEALKHTTVPVILVLNKIDKITQEGIMNAIITYKDLYDFADIIPISALKKDNIARLISLTKNYLSDNIKYYDDDTVTNNDQYFMIQELVREKILNLTNDEVPHSVTCILTQYKEKSNIIEMAVDIIVTRDSLKKIIIGKQGNMLKTIGTEARLDIERMLGKQVYLELYVKTVKNWRNKEKYLLELGFNDK
ncbi:MAG: GTPase Era [Bacilli bacterium]|nr:GTPase Era [Bacilli bacterium]MDE6142195.1 GTPase Era [Bacilli bacterium]